jgi:hypothetical protein
MEIEIAMFPSSANLVIIGAGTAGLYLASRLSSDQEVLILESGSASTFNGNDSKNKVITNGPYKNGQSGRARGVGGTTNLWGGQMLPFSSTDLTQNKGWPLTWEDLELHYEEVSQILLNEPCDYLSYVENRTGWEFPVVNSPLISIHASKWLCQPRFKQSLLPQLSSNIRIQPDCTVKAIESTNPGYKIHLDQKGKSGSLYIQAKKIVLAAGTIESIRLLLYSRDYHGLVLPETVGRGFMDHLSVDICELSTPERFNLLKNFNTRWVLGKKYSIRMSTTPEWIAAHWGLNISAMIMVREPGQRKYRLINKISAIISALGLKFIYKPLGKIVLNIMVEQISSPSSNVTLTDDSSDKVYLPKINWRPQLSELKAIQSFADAVLKKLKDSGYINSYTQLPSLEELENLVEDVCHPMGGLAMHHNPTKRIVNEQLEVLNNPNLFVCSAAVFPSGSHSNPTMTILALANRLASYLNQGDN